MRFFLTFLIWVVIVGGLYIYVSKRDADKESVRQALVQEIAVKQLFTLEFTPTFAIEQDPFALQTDENASAGIEVRLNGKLIKLEEQQPARGEVLRIAEVDGVVLGHNEIYVKASPPMTESHLEHGVRMKVIQGNEVLVDKTIWSSGGALISGTVPFEFAVSAEGDAHDH